MIGLLIILSIYLGFNIITLISFIRSVKEDIREGGKEDFSTVAFMLACIFILLFGLISLIMFSIRKQKRKQKRDKSKKKPVLDDYEYHLGHD